MPEAPDAMGVCAVRRSEPDTRWLRLCLGCGMQENNLSGSSQMLTDFIARIETEAIAETASPKPAAAAAAAAGKDGEGGAAAGPPKKRKKPRKLEEGEVPKPRGRPKAGCAQHGPLRSLLEAILDGCRWLQACVGLQGRGVGAGDGG